MKNSVFSFFIFLVFSLPAHAGNVDGLKTAVETALTQSQSAAQQQGITMSYEGELHIEDAGKYYALTLPEILRSPTLMVQFLILASLH